MGLRDKLLGIVKPSPLAPIAPAGEVTASPDPGYSAAKGSIERVGPIPQKTGPARVLNAPAETQAIEVELVCTHTGKPFYVGMVKRAGAAQFKIAGYTRNPLTAAAARASFGVDLTTIDAAKIAVSSLDWGPLRCPHCDAAGSSVILCGSCNRYCCTGRNITRTNGTILHTCADDCGNHGAVTYEYETVTTKRVVASPASPGVRVIPDGRANLAHLLPGPRGITVPIKKR